MGKTRILIVDDSVVIRRMLTNILPSDPDLEVVGSAPNGLIALAKISQLNPDVVILDIEMPEMDGLEMLSALRKTHPHLPVIIFSVHTERGTAATLEALTLGANDYVTKPANLGSAAAAEQQVRGELIPKIKLYVGAVTGSPALGGLVPGGPGKRSLPAAPDRCSQRVDVVVVGLSTGGPNALVELLPQFPADFPVPLLIVQHMPPVFTKLLADRLASKSHLRVAEGNSNQVLKTGHAWLAPGDFHMVVERNGQAVRIRTHKGPPENSCRPAVDALFRSVAEIYGPHVLAVVMTGMGQDGLRGCKNIHDAGGQILVQDEASSVVWGMPGLVANAGLADKVLPLNQLGAEIVRRVFARREGQPSPPVQSQVPWETHPNDDDKQR